MAVSKIWPVRNRIDQVIKYVVNPEKTDKNLLPEEDYQALKDVLVYAKDEEKTEKEFYTDSINCTVAIAREQFVTVKQQFGKEDGIQAYHGYLSFAEYEVTPEQCQFIGMEFAKATWGERFQVVVTTHLNTKHLHCHFVVNSVSFLDGKRLSNKEKHWCSFRHTVDELCRSHGLTTVVEPDISKKNQYLKKQDEKGLPTRYNILRDAIDHAISHSKTLVEFQYALKEMGYSYQLSESRKYWTVTPKGSKKPIRLKNLGDEYTNARIEARIKENRQRWHEITSFSKKKKRRQYQLATRGEQLKKRGGLRGLYLHYCYELGYLPKYKNNPRNQRYLHYLLKDDLRRLDQFSNEVRFMSKYKIDTSEELYAHEALVDQNIHAIEMMRKEVRKELRKELTEDEREKRKEKVGEWNDALKVLRTEKKYCIGIRDRSKLMTRNLMQIQVEELQQGKGKKDRRENRINE